jgi:hypothetical protein
MEFNQIVDATHCKKYSAEDEKNLILQIVQRLFVMNLYNKFRKRLLPK